MFSCVMLGGKKFCSTVLKPVSIKSSLLHFLSLFLAHFLPSSLFNSSSFLCGPTKRMTIILCQIQWLVSWQLGKRTRSKTLNLECNLDCDTPTQNKKITHPPMLWISTSFQVLAAPESWSNYYIQWPWGYHKPCTIHSTWLMLRKKFSY